MKYQFTLNIFIKFIPGMVICLRLYTTKYQKGSQDNSANDPLFSNPHLINPFSSAPAPTKLALWSRTLARPKFQENGSKLLRELALSQPGEGSTPGSRQPARSSKKQTGYML